MNGEIIVAIERNGKNYAHISLAGSDRIVIAAQTPYIFIIHIPEYSCVILMMYHHD